MKTKFIHDDFELDVSDMELTWTEENTWFKDEFFLSSSFPFELDYSRVPFFQKFQHENLATSEVYFEGKLQKDGRIEEAILEIEEADGKLRCTIRYGDEALPNWNKPLSELELDVVLENGGNMRLHAQTVVNKTYPEVNYNFPAIHTEFYEGAAMFEDFEGVINKRHPSTGFVLNSAPPGHVYNKNIVYPFPYHLYVLKKAVEDAGYTLKGDILTDPDFMDAIIIPGKKIFEFENLPRPVEWVINSLDIVENCGNWLYRCFYAEMEVNYRGAFHLTGFLAPLTRTATIKLNGVVIFSYYAGMPISVDLRFTTTSENNLLEIDIVKQGAGIAAVLNLKTLTLLDENGQPIPFLANFSRVHLAEKLPDMTVGDFIKFHKKAKNYDFDIRSNGEIWMNLIQNEVSDSEAVDVTEFEPPKRQRKFEQAKSFVLQYEGEFEDYDFTKIFIDQKGYLINDFQVKENTTEININAIPLPVETIDGITTAVQISDDAAKLMLVKYNGLVSGQNWTQPMPNLDCLNLYLNYWQRWINFMIHSVKFVWQIKAHPNLLINIKRKSKLFSFNNLLFVHTLNRRRKKDVEEIDIEAYSTKI